MKLSILPSLRASLGALGALAIGLSVSLSFSLPASAHTLLKTPVPLIPEDDAKSGPCGCYFGGGPEDPGDDGSPIACPTDYSVTTITAGEPLKVEWIETVNHAGDFRIAFSSKAPEQVSKADMDAGEIMTVPDDNATSGATLSQMITVPNEPCELCTIQLRQFMMGAAQPYYYTCAAVKIVPAAGTTSSSTTTTTTTGAGGSTMGQGGGGSGGSGDGGSVPSSGAGMANPEPSIKSGCSVPATGSGAPASGSLAVLGLAAAAAFSMRRRRG